MAVIAEGVTSNGVRYRICDDCMARRGTPEYERAAERQRRAAYDILRGWAERHEGEEGNHGHDDR